MVRNKIVREQAMDAIRGLFFYRYILKALHIQYQFPECRLIYVPFWKLRAYVTGRVDGYVDEGGEVPDMVPATRHVFKTTTWTGIASSEGNTHVRYLRNMAYEEEPYDASLRPSLRVTLSADDAVIKGSKAMEKSAIRQLKNEGLYSAKLRRVNIYPLEVTLVFYPVWIVKYSISRLTLQAAVDGVTGEMLAGGKTDDYLKRFAVACIVACIFAIVLGITFMVNYLVGYLLLIIITGPGYRMIADSLAFIRYGSSITDGKIEELYKRPRKIKCKDNRLAFIFLVIGYIILVFSIVGLAAATVTFYILVMDGLALYLSSSLFVCDMRERISNLRDDL
jgi:hypothetical protein